MNKEYHILNGDALRGQLPHMNGEIIVFRECLVDGPVLYDISNDFWEGRAKFVHKEYNADKREYFEKSKAEILRITKTPLGSEIYLWF